MPRHDREELPPLLMRRSAGRTALAHLESLGVAGAPEIGAALCANAQVLWLGHVAIRDAVPLAAVMVLRDGDAMTVVRVSFGERILNDDLRARLARDLVSRCRADGCTQIVVPSSPGPSGHVEALRDVLDAYGRVQSDGPEWALGL
jgi:hypothetical protein